MSTSTAGKWLATLAILSLLTYAIARGAANHGKPSIHNTFSEGGYYEQCIN